MRVLVTGATGFLGGHCLRVLSEQGGFEVRGTGRRMVLAPEGFDVTAADLSDPAALARLPKVDAVVHTAALSSPWGPLRAFEQANVQATSNLLSWAQDAGVQRFVHVSTPALYFAFRDQFDVREDHPQGPPINAYAATKAQAERLVEHAPINSIILRPRAIYGPGDTALLPRLQRAIAAGPLPVLRGGQAQTNLTHVRDVCSAILSALQRPAVNGVVNVAGKEVVRLTDLVEQLAARLDLQLRWRTLPLPAVMAAAQVMEWGYRAFTPHTEPRFTRYSAGLFAYSLTMNTDRARHELGWEQSVNLEAGINDALSALQSNQAGAARDPS